MCLCQKDFPGEAQGGTVQKVFPTVSNSPVPGLSEPKMLVTFSTSPFIHFIIISFDLH